MNRPSPDTGILPYQDIKRLIASRTIEASLPIEDRQIQPASLDLRLGRKAYRLISSFLPELSTISSRLDVLDFYQSDLVMYEMDLTDGAILEKGHVYLVPLLEHLKLPKTVRARANPKSTTGRLDVFTRIVTDLTAGFDEIRAGYQGALFLEVVPRSFAVKVRTGQSLNQIRFIRGAAAVADSALLALHRKTPLLYRNDAARSVVEARDFRADHGLFLRIDLKGEDRANSRIIGYRAKKNSHVIDLGKVGHYAAADFWEPLHRNRNGSYCWSRKSFISWRRRNASASRQAMRRRWSRMRPPVENCAPTMQDFSTLDSAMAPRGKSKGHRRCWKSDLTMCPSLFMTAKRFSKWFMTE